MSRGKWIACGVTGLLVATSLTAYAGYRDALGVDTQQVDPDGWGDRPDQVDGVHNVLLLGADNESEGVRPDVLVVVTIDVDDGTVTMVNLPRDLVVDIPECDPVDGSPGWSGGRDQLNHAMVYGGMDCQGNTVETVTGVHLDHQVMVDFAGFENIVDTVGGVEVCVPEPVDDPKARLRLDAGLQTLDGEEALGLARSRDSTENRDDLGRIESQQRLMGALVRKVTGGDVLSSPSSVYGFLDSVTDSLVTDDSLTVDAMADLTIAMREVDLEEVDMVTAPVVDSETHQYKVELQEPAAEELFGAVAAGEALPVGDEESEIGASGADPSEVSVEVLNGTGINGLAKEVEGALAGEGFTVTGTGNPALRAPAATTVYHGPGQEAHAEALASVLTTARVEEAPDLGDDLELVMGADDWGPVGTAGDGGGAPQTELDSTSAADRGAACD